MIHTIEVDVVPMEPRRFQIYATMDGYHFGGADFSGTRAQARKRAAEIKRELHDELNVRITSPRARAIRFAQGRSA